MNFRSFLESKVATSRLSKDFQQDFQIKHFGVTGWWNLTIASKNDLSSLEKKVTSSFPNIAKETMQKMSYLGFRSQRSNLLIDDSEEKKVHTIQGILGYPTYASYFRHSIKIHISDLNTNTLIHEHSHMVWRNLPKTKKELFINWFESKKKEFTGSKEFIDKNQYVSEDERKQIKEKFDKSKNIEYSIVRSIVHEIYHQDEVQYFRPNRLLSKLLKTHGDIIPVVSKKDLTFETFSGGKREIKKGQKIYVGYYSGRFILTHYTDSYDRQHEYMTSLSEDEIGDYIEVDPDLIKNIEFYNKKYKTRFDDDLNNITTMPPISYYTPKNKEKQIVEIIEQTIKAWLLTSYPNLYKLDYIDGIRIFNSFRAKLRLRKGKIKDFNDVVNTLAEVLKTIVRFINLKHSTERIEDKKTDFGANLSKPEGNNSRIMMQKLFNLPSDYSAANPNELFAEVVSYAANDLKSISKELRMILFEVLR